MSHTSSDNMFIDSHYSLLTNSNNEWDLRAGHGHSGSTSSCTYSWAYCQRKL